jgi:SAM-dependent methyltransferase
VTWLWILLVALGATALGLLIYWQLVVAEGTYLGPRAVSTGYDWFARRYDGVKRFDPYYERWFIAGPLMQALWPVQKPLLLDVAIGTGRLPVALLHEGFAGQVAGLDLSLGMLRQAMTKLEAYGDQVFLVRQDASVLPFDDGSFDAVTCLESLEFMPRPQEVLAEMVRAGSCSSPIVLERKHAFCRAGRCLVPSLSRHWPETGSATCRSGPGRWTMTWSWLAKPGILLLPGN